MRSLGSRASLSTKSWSAHSEESVAGWESVRRHCRPARRNNERAQTGAAFSRKWHILDRHRRFGTRSQGFHGQGSIIIMRMVCRLLACTLVSLIFSSASAQSAKICFPPMLDVCSSSRCQPPAAEDRTHRSGRKHCHRRVHAGSGQTHIRPVSRFPFVD